ncbi:ATP-binding cassette domain-containing protein [Actibacterium sp. 188UL27-1]|uniref:ATP-binding cassette domain-containing protein n=1 Tax=Actibacterium sp. 188UL27-1 TaxID=2786961 RepID=UPI001957E768|nr:ATP-binding cassette domain-containing protein [Actibacterium sp. 188UL27-1]MBM7067192.1 ATP-binding cassette domain-containing protein [Actibacterium sp. 188UL27-1]
MLDVLKFKTPNPATAKGKGQIAIDDVSITFGAGSEAHRAVETTSSDIQAGEFVCILRPSGCGKSTLLNAIAGYVTSTTGQVTVDGVPVENPGPDRGMLFQQCSLLAWKTVYETVAFGPKMAGQSRTEAGATAIPGTGWPQKIRQPLSGRAVGRDATARRHRPRLGQLPVSSADGRPLWRA